MTNRERRKIRNLEFRRNHLRDVKVHRARASGNMAMLNRVLGEMSALDWALELIQEVMEVEAEDEAAELAANQA